MPIVECGRLDCMYNEEGYCSGERIALHRGRCLAFVSARDLRTLMRGRPSGVHRSNRRYKNNAGKIVT